MVSLIPLFHHIILWLISPYFDYFFTFLPWSLLYLFRVFFVLMCYFDIPFLCCSSTPIPLVPSTCVLSYMRSPFYSIPYISLLFLLCYHFSHFPILIIFLCSISIFRFFWGSFIIPNYCVPFSYSIDVILNSYFCVMFSNFIFVFLQFHFSRDLRFHICLSFPISYSNLLFQLFPVYLGSQFSVNYNFIIFRNTSALFVISLGVSDNFPICYCEWFFLTRHFFCASSTIFARINQHF